MTRTSIRGVRPASAQAPSPLICHVAANGMAAARGCRTRGDSRRARRIVTASPASPSRPMLADDSVRRTPSNSLERRRRLDRRGESRPHHTRGRSRRWARPGALPGACTSWSSSRKMNTSDVALNEMGKTSLRSAPLPVADDTTRSSRSDDFGATPRRSRSFCRGRRSAQTSPAPPRACCSAR